MEKVLSGVASGGSKWVTGSLLAVTVLGGGYLLCRRRKTAVVEGDNKSCKSSSFALGLCHALNKCPGCVFFV